MRVIEQIEQLREAIRSYNEQWDGASTGRSRPTVGFVPTMGYLHQGHISLLRQAKAQDDLVVLSIFVNPLQFGPNEDFDRYPRNTEADLTAAEEAGVDLVFMPSVSEMYPEYPLATRITVGETAARLCGATRPGHFDGVATVVMKLFHIVQPDHAYFGLKDAQQIAVLKQVSRDLNSPVQIIPCPIVREADGLALSSRNVYLSVEERAQAIALSQSLHKAEQLIGEGELDAGQLESVISSDIASQPLAKLDYVSVLSYPSLQPIARTGSIQRALDGMEDQQIIVALAAWFGSTRLIDNRIFTLMEVKQHV